MESATVEIFDGDTGEVIVRFTFPKVWLYTGQSFAALAMLMDWATEFTEGGNVHVRSQKD